MTGIGADQSSVQSIYVTAGVLAVVIAVAGQSEGIQRQSDDHWGPRVRRGSLVGRDGASWIRESDEQLQLSGRVWSDRQQEAF
jgi:hypothetical protein